jgi:succinyl-CoA synthetase beta subunit
MKLHEYQGKTLLRSEGVDIPESRVSYFPEEAWMISMDIGYPVMLKAQVLAEGVENREVLKNATPPKRFAPKALMFGTVLKTSKAELKGLKYARYLLRKRLNTKRNFMFLS